MKNTLYVLLLLSLLLSACAPGGALQPSPTASLPPGASLPTGEAALQPSPGVAASPTHSALTKSPTRTPLPPTSTSAPTTAAPTLPASLQATSPASSTATGQPPILVDHTSVELFDQIPEEFLQAARALRMMYADASVGNNISETLDCLAASGWAESLPYCRMDYIPGLTAVKTYTRADFSSGNVPANILFTPSAERYDRSNWTFVGKTNEWSHYTQDFIENIAPGYLDEKDVLSYQFNYQHVAGTQPIANPETGFFSDNPDRYDVHDLEAFIAQHPDKTFYFWTTSLARSIGTQEAADFNTQMREYAIEHDKILFDVADIESHTPAGEPCYDNRDGVEYCDMHGNCENFPDDGLDLPAICQAYTSELEGGHLGATAAGGLRLAKAMWVLMAQIAGWRP